jgi:hypothetical protein
LLLVGPSQEPYCDTSDPKQHGVDGLAGSSVAGKTERDVAVAALFLRYGVASRLAEDSLHSVREATPIGG